MKEQQNGGAAFPSIVAVSPATPGMMLRDYFAAQALNGALARTSLPDYDLRAMFGANRTGIMREEIIAADAYRIADAMLARRGCPQETTVKGASDGS